MTELVAVEADITTLGVDAVVNAANSELAGGGGVDGAIHRAGGPAIYESMATYRARGGCPTGEAVIGTGGDLPARFVIHTVGPIWTGDDPHRHDALLASCYRSSLALADEHQLATVAFPNISTGVYGFPKDRAAGVAVGAVRDWLADHPHTTVERVTFVCFDAENLALYRHLLA
jgi:O-acetyl-ADP-ribose deacetylase